MIKAFSLLLALSGLAPMAASVAHAQDAVAGAKKADMCVGCHGIPGYQSSFPQIHKVPKIAGQKPEYIVAALSGYKKGERKHPTMRAITSTLSDKDMADLGAYYYQLGGPATTEVAAAAPQGEVGALLTKGGCIACHGANFNQPLPGAYPKLAGQHPDYLYVALKAYQTEGNPQVGRGNAIMAAQVKPFKHEELKLMAEYLSTLPGDVKTVAQSKFR
jgi:cytochrome c553